MQGSDNPILQQDDAVQSPCIGACALNDDDICVGCFRSSAEIAAWSQVDNEVKRSIVNNAKLRMNQSK